MERLSVGIACKQRLTYHRLLDGSNIADGLDRADDGLGRRTTNDLAKCRVYDSVSAGFKFSTRHV